MHRFLIGVLGIFLFLCGTETANAGCGVREQVVFAPRSGARVGPNPMLWLFLPQGAKHDDGTLAVQDDKGAPLTYELESLTNEAPVPVVRLKVTAPRGAVNVSFGSGSGYSLAHYTVDKNGLQLRSAPWASPSVVEVKYIFATGCGSSNAFVVHVTPKADVYRIQAENKIWLVPDLSSDYSIYDGHGVLTVGHIACSEFSLPFNNPVGFDWTPQWSNGVEGLEYSPVCHVVPPPRRSGEVLGRGFECTSAVQFEFSGLVKRR